MRAPSLDAPPLYVRRIGVLVNAIRVDVSHPRSRRRQVFVNKRCRACRDWDRGGHHLSSCRLFTTRAGLC